MSGQGVGPVQIVVCKRLLPVRAIKVNDASRCFRGVPQQYAQDGGHRLIGDAHRPGQFLVFLDARTKDRLALAEAAASQGPCEKLNRDVFSPLGQWPEPSA